MAGFDDMASNDEEDDGGDPVDALMEGTEGPAQNLEDQYLNVGIFGQEKTGKSHFSLTAPGPIYYIDTENGTVPLEPKFPDKDVSFLRLTEVADDFNKQQVENYKEFMRRVELLVQNEDKFETVVIDSFSDMWQWVRNYARTEIFGLSPDEGMGQQWNWGTVKQHYNAPLKSLLQADFNVVLTSKAEHDRDNQGNKLPQLNPKWEKHTGYWLNVVLQMEKERMENNVKHKGKIAASRFETKPGEDSIMGTEIENPTWDKLTDVLSRVV